MTRAVADGRVARDDAPRTSGRAYRVLYEDDAGERGDNYTDPETFLARMSSTLRQDSLVRDERARGVDHLAAVRGGGHSEWVARGRGERTGGRGDGDARG